MNLIVVGGAKLPAQVPADLSVDSGNDDGHGKYKSLGIRISLPGITTQGAINGAADARRAPRILAHNVASRRPRFLSPAQVERIDKRPDELARRKGFV